MIWNYLYAITWSKWNRILYLGPNEIQILASLFNLFIILRKERDHILKYQSENKPEDALDSRNYT